MRAFIETCVVASLFVAIAATSAFAGTPVPVRVPEPASLAMLAAGIAGVAALRRARRRS